MGLRFLGSEGVPRVFTSKPFQPCIKAPARRLRGAQAGTMTVVAGWMLARRTRGEHGPLGGNIGSERLLGPSRRSASFVIGVALNVDLDDLASMETHICLV